MANEKRLIDANALKEQIIKEIHHYWNEGEGGYYLAEDTIPDIDNAPTVDAVEVVRCKDCVSGHKQIYGGLYRCNVMGCGGLKPDDFCSYGERR